MPIDDVTSAFREWGRDNGFTRKGTTLYRDQPETLAVVNLQGSQWGGRKYVNVALWLKAVAEPFQPKENQCHMRTCLTQLVPDAQSVERILESDVQGEEARGQALRAILDNYLTPVLAQSGTLRELKANRPGFVDRFLLGREALPLLDSP